MSWSLNLILLISNFNSVNFIQQCFYILSTKKSRSFSSFFNSAFVLALLSICIDLNPVQ